MKTKDTTHYDLSAMRAQAELKHIKALAILRNCISAVESDSAQEFLAIYSRYTRLYAIPKQKKQDEAKPAHRLSDMIGGIPYTSALYPWPLTDGSGNPMQPICQVDLGAASLLLGKGLGTGLLQLWGRVDDSFAVFQEKSAVWTTINEMYEGNLTIRIIPKESLTDSPEDTLPDRSRWESADEPSLGGMHPFLGRLPDLFRQKSLVSWPALGFMFAHSAGVEHDGKLIFTPSQDFEVLLEFFDVFDWPTTIPVPGNAPDVYLGGFGGQARGDEDPSLLAEILIRLNFKIGMDTHVGVLVDRDTSGNALFKPFFRFL